MNHYNHRHKRKHSEESSESIKRAKVNNHKKKQANGNGHRNKDYSTSSPSSSSSSSHSSSSASSKSKKNNGNYGRDGSSKSSTKNKQKVENDKEGHLIHKEGDVLNNYKLYQTLGQGTFGKVVETKHLKSGKRVALKIIRNVPKYRVSALTEIDILKKIHKTFSKGRLLCACLLDWFEWHGHICIAFELLGKSIFDFLKRNYYYPYPMDHIQQISYQLIRGVKFLHDNKLTHTDLKPENILFVDSSSEVYKIRRIRNKDREIRRVKCTNIQIIDFGSATFEHDHHSRVVSTRHYRAPEVVLELGWSHACDIWSIGCILFELYTGHTLFQMHDNLEHLAMMERILGSIPTSMALKSQKTKFFQKGSLLWDKESEDGLQVRQSCKPLYRYMRLSSHKPLFDLISSMLQYQPNHRIPLDHALNHEFFK